MPSPEKGTVLPPLRHLPGTGSKNRRLSLVVSLSQKTEPHRDCIEINPGDSMNPRWPFLTLISLYFIKTNSGQ